MKKHMHPLRIPTMLRVMWPRRRRAGDPWASRHWKANPHWFWIWTKLWFVRQNSIVYLLICLFCVFCFLSISSRAIYLGGLKSYSEGASWRISQHYTLSLLLSTTIIQYTLARHSSIPPFMQLNLAQVHSSFKPISNPDFVIPVTIEGHVHHVYVLERPGTAEFLDRMNKHYEIICFTASLSKYANPLLDLLDKNKTIRGRLYREHCVYHSVSAWRVAERTILFMTLLFGFLVSTDTFIYIVTILTYVLCVRALT